MPVKDPHESFFFLPPPHLSFFFFLLSAQWLMGMMWENMIISLCLSLRCCLYLAHLGDHSALECLFEKRANHEQGR